MPKIQFPDRSIAPKILNIIFLTLTQQTCTSSLFRIQWSSLKLPRVDQILSVIFVWNSKVPNFWANWNWVGTAVSGLKKKVGPSGKRMWVADKGLIESFYLQNICIWHRTPVLHLASRLTWMLQYSIGMVDPEERLKAWRERKKQSRSRYRNLPVESPTILSIDWSNTLSLLRSKEPFSNKVKISSVLVNYVIINITTSIHLWLFISPRKLPKTPQPFFCRASD